MSTHHTSRGIGRWDRDDAGLPVFVYTGALPYRHHTEEGTRIDLPEDPWFILGNYMITAFAHTCGSVDLYTAQRAWGQCNTGTRTLPATSAHVVVDHRDYLLTGTHSSIACTAQKIFGTGFAAYTLQVRDDLSCTRTVSLSPSPSLRDGIPALAYTIRLHNHGTDTLSLEYTESMAARYRQAGVSPAHLRFRTCPQPIAHGVMTRFTPVAPQDMLGAPPHAASYYDWYPPAVFMAWQQQEEGSSYGWQPIDGMDAQLTLSRTIRLSPGETITLRYAAGCTFTPDSIEDTVHTLLSRESTDPCFRHAWKETLPDYACIQDTVTRREMYWNTYTVEAMASYSRYFDETYIPQGMHYDYLWGMNAAMRDILLSSLPAAYFNPELARSILRMTLKTMQPTGAIHYNVYGYGYTVPTAWCPSDFQLHLFWAVAHYCTVTNDYAFLLEETPYYPGTSSEGVSVLDKLKQAYRYLHDRIGTGSHGLLRLLNADWNDAVWAEHDIARYFETAQSHYNTTMAAVVLARLGTMLDKAATYTGMNGYIEQLHSFRDIIMHFRREQVAAFINDLGSRTFIPRAHFDHTSSLGVDSLYLESQLFALMIDEIPLSRRQEIVDRIEQRVMDGEVLGARIRERPSDSHLFTPGIRENGAIWYYTQGLLALALNHVDPKKAHREIEKMRFTHFTAQYPDYWPGQWSAGDCVNAEIAKCPGLTDTPSGSWLAFPVYCSHRHVWPILFYFMCQEDGAS